jgi:hypothetical protein
MSSNTWTPDALRSEARSASGSLWRLVEKQSISATLPLTDNLEEQHVLEQILDEYKPPYPEGCDWLDFLLKTPFRYRPTAHGSRFRRKGSIEGVFYAADKEETAVMEHAFYQLLFYAESPDTSLPRKESERHAFSVTFATEKLIDLTKPKLNENSEDWTQLVDYSACQDLADRARLTGIDAIRFQSVRDPQGYTNVALLTPAAFESPNPVDQRTWYFLVQEDLVRLRRDFPKRAFEIPTGHFAIDPRLGRFRNT